MKKRMYNVYVESGMYESDSRNAKNICVIMVVIPAPLPTNTVK